MSLDGACSIVQQAVPNPRFAATLATAQKASVLRLKWLRHRGVPVRGKPLFEWLYLFAWSGTNTWLVGIAGLVVYFCFFSSVVRVHVGDRAQD